jgi:hypothetical protein
MVQVQQSLPRRRLVPLQYGQPITKLVNAQRDMREIETVDAIGNLHYTALLNSVTISVSTHGLRVPKRIRKKDPILNEYIKATIHVSPRCADHG